MNIYKLTRNYEKDDEFYDSYEGAIVIASSAEEARHIHPNQGNINNVVVKFTDQWVEPERVTVELIGTIDPSYMKNHPGEVNILNDFNAG